MVKVTHLADDGTEMATIEVDDFTIEVIYSGIADMLREAALSTSAQVDEPVELSREARLRRDKILTRLRG